jgi:CRP-like cAMP-binding protein
MTQSDTLNLQLLEGFSAEELEEIHSVIEQVQFSAGETVLYQNHRATTLYIVVSGEVEILHKPYDAPTITINRLSSGGVFGWSAILGRKVYS